MAANPLIAYSTGRIKFIPNNRQDDEHEYSTSSIIELKEVVFPNGVLYALDVKNNKQKIFEIPLKKENQYKYGNSVDNPDEVPGNTGTYHLWLNEKSRDKFHEALGIFFMQLAIMDQSNNESPKPDPKKRSDDNYGPRTTDNNSNPVKSAQHSKPTTPITSPKDLLLDIHLLSLYIEQGDGKEAARQASQLASQGIRLQAKPSENAARDEQEFLIQVRIDGNEFGVDQHGAHIPVNVFQSTTVRELRAIFELVYRYPPTNQYFFVNGCLPHDDLTMKDLDVGPNSLFILFLLKHSQQTGPWKCLACTKNNQSNNLRCIQCSATRQK